MWAEYPLEPFFNHRVVFFILHRIRLLFLRSKVSVSITPCWRVSLFSQSPVPPKTIPYKHLKSQYRAKDYYRTDKMPETLKNELQECYKIIHMLSAHYVTFYLFTLLIQSSLLSCGSVGKYCAAKLSCESL